MLLLNNENRVIILNRSSVTATDYLEDEFKIVLKPGANEVDTVKWDLFKDHRMTQKFIDVGYIEPREKGFESIKAMSPREAADMVKLTSDRPALEKMLKIETRPLVKEALKKQLESLEQA